MSKHSLQLQTSGVMLLQALAIAGEQTVVFGVRFQVTSCRVSPLASFCIVLRPFPSVRGYSSTLPTLHPPPDILLVRTLL